MELSFKRPDYIVALTSEEREVRCKESDDVCVVKWERYFVRGVIPLPVEGHDQPYGIGAWVEISESDFRRTMALWSSDDQSSEPPFDGVLANSIPNHSATIGLAVTVALTGPSTRPDIIVADAAHALYEEQQVGITRHRAYEYTSLFAK